MIARYNRTQLIKASFAMILGLLCLYLAFCFFSYMPAFVASRFGYRWSPLTANFVGCLGLLAVAISGYRTWKAKGGHYGYHESSLYHDLGDDSAGAFMMDFYAHRVTGPAHIISQIFLAGPLQLLNARTLLGSRLPDTPELEINLVDTLAILRTANKWQSIDEYPTRKTEVLYLAQMKLIDFSAHKGIPRIKAN